VGVFDVDALVADCRAARTDAEPRRAIRAVLERALADSAAMADALRRREGGLEFLHRGPDLTVINIVWAPKMRLYPHDHRMWAAIGIYTGREDNAFFRRDPAAPHRLIESGGKEISAGDVLLLGDEAIHAVANPADRHTGAIHVYGGDFVSQPRSQWGPGEREERPYDMNMLGQQFADANRAWAESGGR
jgi:predicted metal-dependent enzyme (double-stranded beta helix superfamily)